jgi:AcrR family transcriptional regulator
MKTPKRGTRAARHPAYRSVDRRRAAIAEALLQSMSEKGFSATSLTELARRAGMSPSHLLYYYPDKEAVLVQLAKSINDGTLGFMAGLVDKPPQVQCHQLVGYFFGRRNVPAAFRGVLLQLMGVATHDPELLGRMRQQAGRFKAFLKQIYRKSSATATMPVDDAATVAAAIWMGLLVNSLFDPTLTMARAGRLMLNVMSFLGGFDNARRSGDVPPASNAPPIPAGSASRA